MKNIVSILKNKRLLLILLFAAGIYLLFFHNIWAYDLMDIDESRYIGMSRQMLRCKDFSTLYVNGEYFFEKPPLYFWIESFVFFVFGKVSAGIGRIPIAIEALLGCFAVYIVSAKAVSRKFALTTTLIAATGLEFLILAKVAILDMLLTSCITISVFSGFMTYFVKEDNKKYFWWAFYLFSALAVMAKGIPGVVIPFGTMFFAGIYSKNLKEYFKPQYFWAGVCIFLAIVLPWHVYMIIRYKALFFNEYIVTHHLARFIGVGNLGKNRPFYYYFVVILWGFFPWIFSFIPAVIKKFKEFEFSSYEKLSNPEKFITFNIIGLILTFAFFTASSSKLVTYILPIYPFMAVLLAEYWLKAGFSKGLKFSSYILSSILLFVGIGGCFIQYILPNNIYEYIKEAQIISCILAILAGALSLYFVKREDKVKLFLTYTMFMVLFSAFGAYHLFNIDYKFGQDDLKEFALYAKEQNKPITTLNVGRKYSINYHADRNVIMFDGTQTKKIKNLLDLGYLGIIRNKDLKTINKSLHYTTVKTGVKYTLITK